MVVVVGGAIRSVGSGSYWRIMDALVAEKGAELQQKSLNPEPNQKKHLGPIFFLEGGQSWRRGG